MISSDSAETRTDAVYDRRRTPSHTDQLAAAIAAAPHAQAICAPQDAS